MSWLATFLDTPARKALPRAAPLWSFRCTAAEYEEGINRGLTSLRATRRPDRDSARTFVLLAAEAIRRGYDGGPWSWDCVHRELRLPHVDQDLRDFTRAGLDAWERPLRKGNDTRYLQSLLAEGGLPLRLLRQEGGRIRSIGAAILRDLQALSIPADEPEDHLAVIAAQSSAPYAQVGYLREPTIHALLGVLLNRVRHAVAGLPPEHAADPAGWLAARTPGWLSELPLDLSEAEASALVQAYLTEAVQVQGADSTARLRAILDPREPVTLRRALVAPRAWRIDSFRAFFGLGAEEVLPRRMAVNLLTESGAIEAAHLLLGMDGGVVETRVVGGETPTLSTVRLELVGLPDGPRIARSVFGDRLPEGLPWVFALGANGQWRMVGTGSFSHPQDRLLVALRGAERGHTGLGGRMLLDVREQTDLTHDGEVFHVRPRGPLTETGELRFDGLRHPYSPPGSDVWSGMPRPLLILSSGAIRPVSPSSLEVRLPGGAWQPWGSAAVGRLELRCRSASCREVIVVAPTDLSVEVSAHGDGGTILAKGPAVADLAIQTQRRGFVAQRLGLPDGAGQSVVVTTEPPLELDVEVHLKSGGRIPLQVPFPRRFAGLVDTRHPAPSWPMGLEDLTWLHAVRVGDRRVRASLTGRLVGSAARREFTVPLASTDAGEHVHQLAARSIRSAVEELLAANASPDAEVLLEVWDRGATGRTTPYAVRRYRYQVCVNDPDACILVLRPTDDATENIGLEALRLDVPGPAWPVPRLRPGTRWLASDLPEGNWLFCARRNGVVVAHPLWAVRSEPGRPRIEDRPPAVDGSEPTDDALRAQVELLATGGVRAAHLPAIACAMRDRTVAVRAALVALRSADPVRALAALVEGLETQPFLWEAIPLQEWEAAADATWELLAPVRAVNKDLALSLLAQQLDRIVDVLPHTGHAFARWMGRRQLPDAWFGRADRAWVHYPDRLREALVGHDEHPGPVEATRRRHVNRTWPTLENGHSDILAEARLELGVTPDAKLFRQVSVHNAHERPLLHGPLLAAQAAFEGRTLPARWVTELRLLRQFDPHWFSLAYRLALAFLLGNHR
ncbi:MAG: STY4851/ECs_5259 family protein [Myxococcota bacterium]